MGRDCIESPRLPFKPRVHESGKREWTRTESIGENSVPGSASEVSGLDLIPIFRFVPPHLFFIPRIETANLTIISGRMCWAFLNATDMKSKSGYANLAALIVEIELVLKASQIYSTGRICTDFFDHGPSDIVPYSRPRMFCPASSSYFSF